MDVEEILKRPFLGNEEELVVALHQPYWDAEKKRGSKSIFSDPRKSASRLSVYPIEKIIEIFIAQIAGGKVRIEAYGVISVDKIKKVGMAGETKVDFEATEDPVSQNAAHAEIIAFDNNRTTLRKRVTASVSRKLSDALDVTVL